MGAADGDAGAAVRCQYIHDIDLHGLALGEGLAGDLLVAGQHSAAALAQIQHNVAALGSMETTVAAISSCARDCISLHCRLRSPSRRP